MNKTGIEYADYTWNPVTGCLHGCDYCYAGRLANGRLKHIYLGRDSCMSFAGDDADAFAPRYWPDRLQDTMPAKPARIFVCDMGDLFGDWVPDEAIKNVLKRANSARRHTFLFLTKNPARLAEFNPWPANAWVGASIDKGYRYVPTLQALAKVEAAVKWVSFEPLLEDLYPLVCSLRESGISWAVIGGLSGRKPFFPPEPWIAGLEGVLNQAGVAIFEKSNLRPRGALIQEYPPAETGG